MGLRHDEALILVRLDGGDRYVRIDAIEAVSKSASGGAIVHLNSGNSHVVSETVEEILQHVRDAVLRAGQRLGDVVQVARP